MALHTIALAILAASALTAQTTVAVSGRITDASNGLPIESAAVTLVSGDFHTLQFTDSAGNYRVDDVPPGTGSVKAEAKGFLPLNDATMSIAADGAAHNFALAPVSSIVGRIRAEDGASVPGSISIVLYREDHTDGVRHWVAGGDREGVPWVGASQLDEDGSFRITNLTPGRYILSAGPPTGNAIAFTMNRITGKPETPSENYVQTYYPGTTDFNAAVPIALREGESATADLNIAKHRLYRIAGELAPGPEPFQGSVRISSVGDGVTHHSYAGSASDSGKFSVEGLPAGQYILESLSSSSVVQSNGSGFQIAFRAIPLSLPFAITDHDLDELRPSPAPPVASLTVQGAFKMANGNPLPANLSVLYAYPKPGLQTDTIPAAPSGEFFLTGPPGDYSVRPVVPPTYAVSEIRYAGGNYLNSFIPFRGGAIDQSLTIVLTDQPGSVSGSLTDDRQKPIAAKVILAPDPLPSNFDFHALRVASTNNDCSFSLNGLTPGRYKATVLTGEDRKRDHDLAILNDKFATADAFEITAGQNLTITPHQ